MNATPADGDHARIEQLLGRAPRGAFEVVVRDDAGDPVVIRNAPLLDDGTPMPTRYWLVGSDEIRRMGRLEAAGGVDAAETDVDPDELMAAHDRYAAERDAALPDDHTGPRPSGGVGGTRVGVKCLHAHRAWHLAGGDDPVGRWIEQRLSMDRSDVATAPTIAISGAGTTVSFAGTHHEMPWGARNLTDRWLTQHDPPHPDELTNALGTITDHLDDLVRLHPEVLDVGDWAVTGEPSTALASLEVGETVTDADVPFVRPTAEEVFRLVATESAAERAHNPGLPADHVETIVATCCIVQAFMRRLHLGGVTLRSGPASATA